MEKKKIEHEVDGKKLITFSKETAKTLGISIGKRLVLLKRIQLLRESAGMGSEVWQIFIFSYLLIFNVFLKK